MLTYEMVEQNRQAFALSIKPIITVDYNESVRNDGGQITQVKLRLKMINAGLGSVIDLQVNWTPHQSLSGDKPSFNKSCPLRDEVLELEWDIPVDSITMADRTRLVVHVNTLYNIKISFLDPCNNRYYGTALRVDREVFKRMTWWERITGLRK